MYALLLMFYVLAQFPRFISQALAFASLRAFLKKYSASFFVADNSVVMQEYMVAFRHILAFHDPELAMHMEEIGLGPELFALPWSQAKVFIH